MPHPSVRVEPGPASFRRVRLDRPDRRNALDLGMVHALHEAFAAEPATPILLDSADPGVFCAGADLTVSDAERADISDLLYECYEHHGHPAGPGHRGDQRSRRRRRRAAGRSGRPAGGRAGRDLPVDRAARPARWPWAHGCCPAWSAVAGPSN